MTEQVAFTQRETPPQDPFHNETIIAENISWEAFLKHYGHIHAEWHEGRVIRIVNNVQHQVILLFLGTLFSTYLKLANLGRVLLAGVPMKVDTGKPAREPDLLIVFNEHYDRIRPTSLEGPADIVVEIVSPESVNRDHGDKLREYELASVQEYWLLNPINRISDVYALHEDGHYRRLPLDAQRRVYSQLMPGFAFDPALLWRDEPPVGVELVQAMLAN